MAPVSRDQEPPGNPARFSVHVVAAFASRLGGVIGQLQVEPDGDAITAALALFRGLPLRGTVTTGDAAFCQRAICQIIRNRRGGHLFAVKANQPAPMADAAARQDFL